MDSNLVVGLTIAVQREKTDFLLHFLESYAILLSGLCHQTPAAKLSLTADKL